MTQTWYLEAGSHVSMETVWAALVGLPGGAQASKTSPSFRRMFPPAHAALALTILGPQAGLKGSRQRATGAEQSGGLQMPGVHGQNFRASKSTHTLIPRFLV